MTPSPSPSVTSSPTSSRPTSSPTTTTFDPSSRPSFVPLTLPRISQVGAQSQDAPQPQLHQSSRNTPSRSPSVPAPSSSTQGRLQRGKYKSDESIAASSSDDATMNPVKMEDMRVELGQGEGEVRHRPVVKKKRTRTLTTPHQSAVLHALLAQSRFPTTAMREEVGRSIGLSARKVQVCFQNQRQKQRKPRTQSTGSGGPVSPVETKRPMQFGAFSGAPQSDSGPEPGPSGTSGLSHSIEYGRRASGHLPDTGEGIIPPRGMPAPMPQPFQQFPETLVSRYGDPSRPYSRGMGSISPIATSGGSFFGAPGPALPPYFSRRSSPFPRDAYASHPPPRGSTPRTEPPIQLPPLRIDPDSLSSHPQRPQLRTSASIPSLSGLEISSPTGSQSGRPVLPPPITLQPTPQFDIDRRLPPSFWGPLTRVRTRTSSDPTAPLLDAREGRALITQPWPLPGTAGILPPPPNLSGRRDASTGTSSLESIEPSEHRLEEAIQRRVSSGTSYDFGRPTRIGRQTNTQVGSAHRATTHSPSPPRGTYNHSR
ncbi:hypothetical protein M422DRAFT_36816 [Sphaerobolus stellatus SS14]|uniref:Homeobox domain-containing protein n=1 Tax=Sphaerobolus stellatus (strain SS14) TaxID=990650 RepID=A0A0C9UWU3_SPHS4|nr:hypothetical protein M422DRAFT_36816 [Sphaerobolus stellatus SS14]